MKSASSRRKLLAAVVISSACAVPVHAQSLNSVSYLAQTTLLYPLSRLFGVNYNYNLTNPYYLGNVAANRLAYNYYGVFRAPGYGPMPTGAQGQILDPNSQPTNFQQNGTNQQSGGISTGTSAQAGWSNQQNGLGVVYDPQSHDRTVAGFPVPQSQTLIGGGGMPPNNTPLGQNYAPGPVNQAYGYGAQSSASNYMPPVAPSIGGNTKPPHPRHLKKPKKDQSAQQAQQSYGQGQQASNQGQQPFNQGQLAFNQGQQSFNQGQQAFNQGRQPFNQGQQALTSTQFGSAPNAVSHISSPMADGFVGLVNSKYNGDVGKALNSADSRAWAHAMGLVDENQLPGADLSQARVSLMSGIMKDPNLDSVSKLEAVKILLRGSAPATSIAGISNTH